MNLAAVHEFRANDAQQREERAAKRLPGLLERKRRRDQRDKERRLLLRAIADLGSIYRVEAAILLGDESPRGMLKARQRLDQLEALGLLVGETITDASSSGWGRRYFRLASAGARRTG